MSSTMIGAVVAGGLCGLVPLVYGLARGETGLAVCGFAACLIAGVLVGVLLAVPFAAVFAWLIWRHSREAHAAAAAAAAGHGAAGDRPEGPKGGLDPDHGRFQRDPAREGHREPSARR
jgi:hypothetical protein